MFKKSPISNRSFNRGFKIFSKILLEPSLRIGKAIVKDTAYLGSAPTRTPVQNEGSYSKSIENYLPYKKTTPNHNIFDIRKRGLDQCSFIHNLYYNTPRPETLLPLEGVLSKYNTASNQYLNKATSCGYDFFTFVKDFFSKQIITVKKEATKRDYQRALDVLPIVSSTTEADAVITEIVNYLSTENSNQE